MDRFDVRTSLYSEELRMEIRIRGGIIMMMIIMMAMIT
jgi:hypothetical protein